VQNFSGLWIILPSPILNVIAIIAMLVVELKSEKLGMKVLHGAEGVRHFALL
jgi:hypothetical protein